MIKKLRLRFIIAALLSILFVLSATIAVINISNYIRTDREAQKSLDMIVENEHLDREGGGGFGFGQQRPGDTRSHEHYFIAVLSTEGEMRYCDTSHIFTISSAQAEELALKVFASDKTQGQIDTLRYKKETITENFGMAPLTSVYISFVDVSEKMNSFNDFLRSSIIVSGVSYAVLAAMIIISSHFVFKTSEESYRKQKAFITNASHELKTPLTIINTDVEILRMDHGDNEWTDSITDQVRRLTTMTNQLVTLSRLDEGSMKNYPLSVISVDKIAEENINAFKPSFENNGFKFSSEVEKDLTIKGNTYLINELFSIFLDNALKYAKNNGSVNLSVKKNKNKVEIIFSNDIEDDEVDVNQLFERFYRSPRSNKKEGSGIGLSIAKEIVDLHKAKISASIKDNKIYFNIIF